MNPLLPSFTPFGARKAVPAPGRLLPAAIALVVYLGGLGLWWHTARLPRRFDTVDPGRLYRSGTVTPGQLARLHRAYGVGRVISLLEPAHPVSRAEQATVRQLGLQWCSVPLPGNGASTPADRDRLRALLLARDARPTLVHCAAGVNRTGLAVGLYRLHQQGRNLAQVLAELHAQDFADLPQHQNLRDALAEEAAGAARGATLLAASRAADNVPATRPASPAPATLPGAGR